MKKISTLFSIIITILIFSTVSFASSDIQVAVNGKSLGVPTVKVEMDGKALKSEVPSIIMVDRTLVPIRFVAESFGAKVTWDDSTKTARLDHNGKIVDLTIDSKVVAIDGKKVSLHDHAIPKLVTFKDLKDTRTMVPVRFVSEVLGYKVGWEASSYTAKISSPASTLPIESTNVIIDKDKDKDKEPIKVEPVKQETVKEEEIVINAANKIENIYPEVVDGRQALVIQGAKDPKYNTIKLSNPDRVVIDIMDSALEGEKLQNFNYKIGLIEGVRVSQFIPDNNYKATDKIVRVVLDIKSGQGNPDVTVVSKGDKLIIYPKADIWEDIKYEYQNNQAVFDIKNSSRTEYRVFYDGSIKEIHIEIPTITSELPEGSYSVNDSLVKEIRVEKANNYTNLRIGFKQNVDYSVQSRSGDDSISILAARNSNIKPSDRTIVIDPGHGGKDPGAVVGKVYEKHIASPVSYLLRDALVQNGYNVIMTREDDRTLNLFDRPKVGNDNKADLFISIHANASSKSTVKGLEVLYCPANERAIKNEDQHPFAKSMHDNILALTNRPGRGLVKRSDLVVLNRTYMPAVLVEVGYMTNPEELNLMLTDEYKKILVQGMVNGVKEYLGD